jgi:hypothetical protein
MVMSAPEAVRTRLLAASTPDEVIGASWDAFESIWQCANELAGRATENFAAWASAAAPACEGREALGRAPSMPQAAAAPGLPIWISGTGERVAARMVGELAALLQERLQAAARQPATPGDARACLRALEAAAEIHGLFAGA